MQFINELVDKIQNNTIGFKDLLTLVSDKYLDIDTAEEVLEQYYERMVH